MPGAAEDLSGNRIFMNKLLRAPAVTVMMPAYNAAKYLAESLRSVLEQDCRDFEIVLVDDGSTDQTYEVAKQFCRDPRLRLYKNRVRKGIVATRNRILSLARGTYLVPHDADDIMLPGRLKAQLRTLKSRPAIGAVFGLAVRLWGKNRFDIIGCRDSHKNGKVTEGVVKTMPEDFHHCSSMVRKELFLNAGGYDGLLSQGEDTRLFRRLFRVAPFYFIKRFCLLYRKHPHSSSATYLKAKICFLKNIFSQDAKKTNWQIRLNGIIMPLGKNDSPVRRQLLWRFNHYAEEIPKKRGRFFTSTSSPEKFIQLLGKKMLNKKCALVNAALLSKDDKGVLIFFESKTPKNGLALLSFLNKGYVYHSSETVVLDFSKKALWSRENIDPLIVERPKFLRKHLLLHNPILKTDYLPMDVFRVGSVGGSCVISKIVVAKFANSRRSGMVKPLAGPKKQAIIAKNSINYNPQDARIKQFMVCVGRIPAWVVFWDWELIKKCSLSGNKNRHKDLCQLKDLL